MDSKNKLVFIVVLIIFIICMYFLISRICKKGCLNVDFVKPDIESSDISVVPTMNDKISKDATWCGTFQLVWNDMVNEVVKKDVEFAEKSEIVDNLNKQDFTENSISEEYYYKKWGKKTLSLKDEIEKGIKEKFNETSDVLDDLDWDEGSLDGANPNIERYLFYTMLKREFSYKEKFDILEKGTFANIYNDVEYFGIDGDTKNDVRDQVDVLYYNSDSDFSVILNTTQGDEVILVRGNNGQSFNEIYDETIKKSEEYVGKKYFTDEDFLKVPNIKFKVKKEYEELQNKEFFTAEGKRAKIAKAIQSIQMEMDEKGGKIKSEAVIDMMLESAALMPEKEDKPRYFYFDDEYTVFLREKGKEKPYFSAHVSDITKFQ